MSQTIYDIDAIDNQPDGRYRQYRRSGPSACLAHPQGPNPRQEIRAMPKAIPIILAFHNLSAGDLADEHGQLSAQIADLETRKRAVAGELISRGLCEAEGALFRSVTVAATMVSSLDPCRHCEGNGRGVHRPVPEI